MGRFLPPDHSKGDESTIAGYMAVHDRPAAFEGADGASYSVAIEVDQTGESDRPWGAFLLFVRWTPGEPHPAGHIESPFLTWGGSEAKARDLLGAFSLDAVKNVLDGLIKSKSRPSRPWWESMGDDAAGGGAT